MGFTYIRIVLHVYMYKADQDRTSDSLEKKNMNASIASTYCCFMSINELNMSLLALVEAVHFTSTLPSLLERNDSVEDEWR